MGEELVHAILEYTYVWYNPLYTRIMSIRQHMRCGMDWTNLGSGVTKNI